MSAQGELFGDVPAQTVRAGYWVPDSDDVETPACYDCAFYRDMRCIERRIQADYRGTCGRFVYRSEAVKLGHAQYVRHYRAHHSSGE